MIIAIWLVLILIILHLVSKSSQCKDRYDCCYNSIDALASIQAAHANRIEALEKVLKENGIE